MTADTRPHRGHDYTAGYLDGLNFAAQIIRELHDYHRTHNAHLIAIRDWAPMHWAWDQAHDRIRHTELAIDLATDISSRSAGDL